MAFLRTMKQGDTRPKLVVLLTSNGSAIDLTGATVRLLMREEGSLSPGVETTGSTDVTSALSGEVTWTPDAADTADAGTYELEFEVTHADGGIETFPNDGYGTLVLKDDIA
jgi:hypothetical protein